MPGMDVARAGLRAAVDEAYEAFAAHASPPPFPLDVCLACCVDAETERQLREWPLHRLTARHLYEYNDSARSGEQSAREAGHFAPRMLDLLARGDRIHHSLEIALRRLGGCPAGGWSDAQRAALARFAGAYFDCAIRADEADEPWLGEPFEVLLMFDIAGVPIAPLLAQWRDCEAPWSSVRYVREGYWHFWSECEVSNAFSSDRPAFRRQVGEWMLDPSSRRHFAARLATPGFRALAESLPQSGPVPFADMVDAVLHMLGS